MIEPLIKIIFLKHGDTFESNDVPICLGAKTDLPLTATGKEQAEKAYLYLTDHHLIPDHIYTGPLKRHLETADILASHFKAPIIPTPDLNELEYGEWEGKTQAEILQKWPETYKAWCEQAILPSLFTHQNALKNWLDQMSHNTEPTSTVVAITGNDILKVVLTMIPELGLSLFENHSFEYYKVHAGHFCIVKYNTLTQKLIIKNWNVAP